MATHGFNLHDTRVINQSFASDWSAQVVPEATIDHLDESALSAAREGFLAKRSNRIERGDLESWNDALFLKRAKIIRSDGITRAALLLLGKIDSSRLLSPHPAQITWELKSADRAYGHFYPPFILATTEIYSRIRNVQIRMMPDRGLIPHEFPKYDRKVIFEALHNCIAHQDYSERARILVTEHDDRLVFENSGTFYEKKPEDYFTGDLVPLRYRNQFLIQAMAELNMVDMMGRGINDVFVRQRERFFPLPDYELAENPDIVRLTIHGKIIDETYSRVLMRERGLSSSEVLALDRIQKGLSVDKEMIGILRSKKLIEGRATQIRVSGKATSATGEKLERIHARARSDESCVVLILDYLKRHDEVSRARIDELLFPEIDDTLSFEQKKRRISGILTKIREGGVIVNTGSKKASLWRLVNR